MRIFASLLKVTNYGTRFASLMPMVNDGCTVCAELMRKSIEASRAHLDARQQASMLVESGQNIDHLMDGIHQLSLARTRAMEQYQDHIMAHREETIAVSVP